MRVWPGRSRFPGGDRRVCSTTHSAAARQIQWRLQGIHTIAVSGQGLTQPNAIVSYNIRLTMPSGESMAIVDSFPVTPEKDGRFHKTVAGTWKTFEFTLTDKYTLSGIRALDQQPEPASHHTS